MEEAEKTFVAAQLTKKLKRQFLREMHRRGYNNVSDCIRDLVRQFVREGQSQHEGEGND